MARNLLSVKQFASTYPAFTEASVRWLIVTPWEGSNPQLQLEAFSLLL